MLWAKCFISSVPVISSVELSLDADVQTSNLLITFLKYSSIVMQDTKGKTRLGSCGRQLAAKSGGFGALTAESLGPPVQGQTCFLGNSGFLLLGDN